jgi:hypothetical protein
VRKSIGGSEGREKRSRRQCGAVDRAAGQCRAMATAIGRSAGLLKGQYENGVSIFEVSPFFMWTFPRDVRMTAKFVGSQRGG